VTVPLTVAPAAGALKPAASPAAPFCTVTGMLREPVLPAGSRTKTVSVVGPSGVPVVSHGMLTGPFEVLLLLATGWPPALTVNVLVPAAAPPSHTTIHCVPRTVAPLAGWVMPTSMVPVPFWTVTARVAAAVAPALSRTVRPSVWPPSPAAVVFQA
jgi:hypothetical protein